MAKVCKAGFDKGERMVSTSNPRKCGLWDLRGSCSMSGSTIPLISSCFSGFSKNQVHSEILQSFPSLLYACKYILFSLSSLLSSYLLPCKAILLVPARRGAYLTVTQKLITPSCFPAAFYILEDLSCLCQPLPR